METNYTLKEINKMVLCLTKITRFTIILIPILIILTWSFSIGQTPYFLIMDENYSMNMGAEDLTTLHHFLFETENRYFRPHLFPENTGKKKAIGITYRLGKTLLLDNQIDWTALIIQHEVFGHGARFREFGSPVNSYKSELFLPLGSGGGFAMEGGYDDSLPLTDYENAMIFSSGCEASGILANSIRDKWLTRGTMNYREVVLYSISANNLGLYILTTKLNNGHCECGDIDRYLNYVNRINKSDSLTRNDLFKMAFINFLNPYNYFSLYTYFRKYLLNGEEAYSYPMIEINSIRYLPIIRLGLAPFGPEIYLENLICARKMQLNLYLRHDLSSTLEFWGGGIKYSTKLPLKHVFPGFEAHFWNQPGMKMRDYNRYRLTDDGTGAAVITNISAYYNKIGVTLRLGYKTDGFLEGENISKGIIMSAGVAVFMDNLVPNNNAK